MTVTFFCQSQFQRFCYDSTCQVLLEILIHRVAVNGNEANAFALLRHSIILLAADWLPPD